MDGSETLPNRPKPKLKTREAILQASIELFNTNGFDNTSIAMICERVGIMAGNLTYHFPKKKDIVLAIAERFSRNLADHQEGLLADLLADGRAVTAREVYQLLRQILQIIWDHRFFFGSMMSLHRLDGQVIREFHNIEKAARAGLVQLVRKGIERDTVRALNSPNSESALADNLWHLMWGTVFFETARDARLEPDENTVIKTCLLQLGAMIEPLVAPQFIAAYSDLVRGQVD